MCIWDKTDICCFVRLLLLLLLLLLGPRHIQPSTYTNVTAPR